MQPLLCVAAIDCDLCADGVHLSRRIAFGNQWVPSIPRRRGRSEGSKQVENILRAIETKYPVNEVLVNGEQVWPYLRIAYSFGYVKMLASQQGEILPYEPTSLLQKLGRLRNVPYGLKNWLGKYDYVALSNAGERRCIEGQYFNKLLDPVIDELGAEKVLYIEIPGPSLYPLNSVHTRHVVCYDFGEVLSVVFEALSLRRYKIENASVLEKIKQEYALEVDDLSMIKRFEARRMAFSLLFRRIRPRALLLTCYYTSMPVVKAAKEAGAKVVECQHGTIGEEHPAYNVYTELDKACFPDYLWVFGRRELKTFDNSRFIEPQDVHPVGSFYIEYVKSSSRPNGVLARQVEKYKVRIGVTLEWTTERRVIEFICRAADMDKTICYLLIPRHPEEQHYAALNLPDNVMIVRNQNFYELMMLVDFHSTVYSTCALEAPSLGVQNILMNVDGLAKRYYGEVLSDSRITRYADRPEEFVAIAHVFERLDRDAVSRLNSDAIAGNYAKNIRELLRRPPFSEGERAGG